VIGRLNIFRMIFSGIRILDGNDMGLLKKICDMFDEAWEKYIYDPASALPTLFDIDEIDDKWLPYLKPLLGFTRDLTFDSTLTELRKILSRAIPFWNTKPSELGCISHAIRMVTGEKFRVQNYFDFRTMTDETCLGEEGENIDPWVIDFFGNVIKSVSATVAAGSPATFTINDAIPEGTFKTTYDYRFLVIEEGDGAGTYPIAYCNAYAVTGALAAAYKGTPGTYSCSLYGTLDEYLSEIRLVEEGAGSLDYDGLAASFSIGEIIRGSDSGALASVTAITDINDLSGTLSLERIVGRFVDNESILGHHGGEAVVKGKTRGIINRTLLKFLLEQNRPLSERYDVIYTKFLDKFEIINDLDQWTHSGTVAVTYPGSADMEAGSLLIPNTLYAPIRDLDSDGIYECGWENYTALCSIRIDTSDLEFDLQFRRIDANNHFLLRWNMPDRLLKLVKVVAGVETVIATSDVLAYFKQDMCFVIRADIFTEDLGSPTTRVRVCIDGDPAFSPEWQVDSAPTHRGGPIAIACIAGAMGLKMVEVTGWPVEIDHVGPPPEPILHYAYQSGWLPFGT
jgi:hypothetical protein